MIGNGHAGFGRAASEKDPQGHLADVVPRRRAIRARSSGAGPANGCSRRCASGDRATGRLPSSYDWSRTHAGRRGGEALRRLAGGEWPTSSVVSRLFGTWDVARAAASRPNVAVPTRRRSATSRLGSNSISMPNPRESTAKSEVLRGSGSQLQQGDLQGFSVCGVDFAHNSGR